jgi:hypothetical protein
MWIVLFDFSVFIRVHPMYPWLTAVYSISLYLFFIELVRNEQEEQRLSKIFVPIALGPDDSGGL